MVNSDIETCARSILSSVSHNSTIDAAVAAIKDEIEKILDLTAPGVVEREPPMYKACSLVGSRQTFGKSGRLNPFAQADPWTALTLAVPLFESTKKTGSRKAQRLAYCAKRLGEASARCASFDVQPHPGFSIQPMVLPRKSPATDVPFPRNQGIQCLEPSSDLMSILMDIRDNLNDIGGY
jgi:hypothetical protein